VFPPLVDGKVDLREFDPMVSVGFSPVLLIVENFNELWHITPLRHAVRPSLDAMEEDFIPRKLVPVVLEVILHELINDDDDLGLPRDLPFTAAASDLSHPVPLLTESPF